MQKSFRVIALALLSQCNVAYTKVLKDRLYIFYNDYHNVNGRPERQERNSVPDTFFDTKNSGLQISVSAIVGKNGGGKSSIVELMMRIINNFAYCSGFLNVHKDLRPVKGLHAILYYEIGDTLYSIVSEGNSISLKRADTVLATYDTGSPARNYDSLSKNVNDQCPIENLLFYTQIFNYSLYAYNTSEFDRENDGNAVWLDGVFHKNDGYQTPLVLNPWRERGSIDVERENGLSKSRLLSLFLTDDETEESFRRIDERQFAESFDVKLCSSSKLEKITLLEYFKTHTLEGSLDFIIKDILGLTNKAKYHSIRDSDITIEKDFVRPLDSLLSFMEKHKTIVSKSAELLMAYYDKEEKTDPFFHAPESDIAKYLRALNQLKDNVQKIDIINKIDSLTIKIEKYKVLALCHLQQIAKVVHCRTVWLDRLQKKFGHSDVNKTLKDLTMDYITYKTFAIISRYPIYKKYRLSDDTGTYDFIEQGDLNQEIKDKIDGAIDQILQDVTSDKSHITLKINQCINFLFFHPLRLRISEGEIPITEYYRQIAPVAQERNIRYQELLLPPIFDVDIRIRQTGPQGVLTNLSCLSSGERQMLSTIGSVIYHLRNIDSVSRNSSTIKYRYVNLVFEEIELYYHPEYQRLLMKRLLDSITRERFQIAGINLCFITHSPFILSDIPKQNVLFLDRGCNWNCKVNTFGANISDILADSFFLSEKLIGEFAYQKIRDTIAWLNDDNADKGAASYHAQLIGLIDEPIVQRKLAEMYDDKMAAELQVKVIDAQIAKLQMQRNKIKSNKGN